jgi:uncharacterized integral membrane protein
MWIVRALLVLILIIVLLGFSAYNAQEKVAVKILNTRYVNVPLVLVAYWVFVFGVLVSFILFATVYLKQVSEIRRFKRQAEALQNEVSALRNRPIEESTEKFLQSGKDEGK